MKSVIIKALLLMLLFQLFMFIGFDQSAGSKSDTEEVYKLYKQALTFRSLRANSLSRIEFLKWSIDVSSLRGKGLLVAIIIPVVE